MSQTTATIQIQEFYKLLETTVQDGALCCGALVPSLKKFFERSDIKLRWTSAPASTALRFHHAFDGGLVVHTMEVFRAAKQTADALGLPLMLNGQKGWRFAQTEASFVSYGDLMATVFLHDLNKIGDTFGIPFYIPNMIKGGSVRSDKIPYVTNDSEGHFLALVDAAPVGSPPAASSPPVKQAFYLAEESGEYVPDGLKSLSLVRALDLGLFTCLSPDVQFAIIHHDGAYGRGRRMLSGNETPLQMIMHFADMWSSRLQHEQYRG